MLRNNQAAIKEVLPTLFQIEAAFKGAPKKEGEVVTELVTTFAWFTL